MKHTSTQSMPVREVWGHTPEENLDKICCNFGIKQQEFNNLSLKLASMPQVLCRKCDSTMPPCDCVRKRGLKTDARTIFKQLLVRKGNYEGYYECHRYTTESFSLLRSVMLTCATKQLPPMDLLHCFWGKGQECGARLYDTEQ